eukprot:tig00000237_g20473.t1
MLERDDPLLAFLFEEPAPEKRPTPRRPRRTVDDEEKENVRAVPPRQVALAEIPPVQFFGGELGLKQLEWEARRAVRAPKSGFKPVYMDFPRQDMAFQYADRVFSTAPVGVFSYERVDGVRRFIVTTYEHFWERYVETPAYLRHYYEVIRENAACLLYLDLEFDRTLPGNAGRDGDAMVATLCRHLGAFLAETYGLREGDLRARASELDSSTEKKFSRHLAFCQLRAAFATNHGQLRPFMHAFARRLEADRASDPEVESLYVDTGKGTKALFVDLGVYTRNRVFRLFGSTKLGKRAYLWPVGWDRAERLRNCAAHRAEFYRALVAHVPYEKVAAGGKERWRLLPPLPEAVVARAPRPAGEGGGPAWDPSGRGSKSSPFPSVDEAVLRAWDRLALENSGVASLPVGVAEAPAGGKPGGARLQNWSYFAASRVLVYTLAGNRFCCSAGRHHRSNGVYLIASLARGTFYQKCFDFECGDFRSNEFPIDPAALPPSGDPGDGEGEAAEEAPTAAGSQAAAPAAPERDSFGMVYDEDFFRQLDAAESAYRRREQGAPGPSQPPPACGATGAEEEEPFDEEALAQLDAAVARYYGTQAGEAKEGASSSAGGAKGPVPAPAPVHVELEEEDEAFLEELAAFEAKLLADRAQQQQQQQQLDRVPKNT